jgi:hypothetical protein
MARKSRPEKLARGLDKNSSTITKRDERKSALATSATFFLDESDDNDY